MRKLLKRSVVALGISIAFAWLTGCASSDEPYSNKGNECREIALSRAAKEAADNLKGFYARITLDAVKFADKEPSTSKNVVISPLSISMMLSMLANGVSPEIQQEILQYMSVSDIAGLNEFASVLIRELPNADPSTEFNNSNSVWYSSVHSLTPAFSRTMQEKYSAELRPTDFGDTDRMLEDLNKWCSLKTHSEMNDFFKGLDPETIVILLNAISFQSKWSDKYFDADKTFDAPFQGMTATRDTRMMEGDITGPYAENEYFQLVSLQFGNHAYTMEILLPKEGVSGEVVNTHLCEALAKREGMNPSEKVVRLQLPKFQVTSQTDLNGVFESSGLQKLNRIFGLTMYEDAMDGHATFRQGAQLMIEEQGVKAASVSSGEISDISPGIPDNVEMIADRPFFFFIWEYSTKACVLSGRIGDL